MPFATFLSIVRDGILTITTSAVIIIYIVVERVMEGGKEMQNDNRNK